MLNKKKFGTLFVAVAMVMGMSTTAFADSMPKVGTGTEADPATVSITKDFEMAEGLSVPSVTFNFTADKVTTDAPAATIQAILYSAEDSKGNAVDGKYIISKNAEISFGTFPHAGEYIYTVKETQGDSDGVTYSQNQYTLRVQVANKALGGTYIQTITAEKGTNNGTSENKVAQVVFTNTYRKNASLIIEKKTTGELADKTKAFDFTITFQKSATEDSLNAFSGTITRNGGTTENITVNGTANFKLADGEKLTFNNVPAGTKYTVTEIGVEDGYTASVKVIENGVEGSVVKGTDAGNLASSINGNYIGENENKVVFENTYNTVPVTGIFLNHLPFILLIGAAVMAFGTLSIFKKHRKSER